MKKFFLGLLLCINSAIFPYSLVFVHIGEHLPDYLEECVAQARIFNPSCDMYIIGNASALVEHEQFFRNQIIKQVEIESLPKTHRHARFLAKTAFLPGFWRYASERFLYIDDLMQAYELEDVFHIENDVMIYADLAELLPVIKQNYKGMAAVFDSDLRCIPSFMFIPNSLYMKQLAAFFVEQTGKQKNDMEIIAMFKNSVDANIIDGLPIIMDSYIESVGLKNMLGQTAKKPANFSNNVRAFATIFDAAAIGQYLGGTFFADKGPGFINETCLFDVSKLTYEWKQDEFGRKIPYAVFQGDEYRINNLHIHSKKLYEFKS